MYVLSRILNSTTIGRQFIAGTLRRLRIPSWILSAAAGAIVVYLAWRIRQPLIGIQTPDFRIWYNNWYETIRNAGFSAFATGFYDYSPPYLYLYWIFIKLFPSVPNLVAIKTIGFSFDVLAALMVWALVRRQRAEPWPLIAFAAILFCPTVILTSAAWGQCDVIYTAFLLAFLLTFLQNRTLLACIMFGLAFAVKPQAGFLAPLVLLLAVRRQIPWKYLVAIPAVYVLLMAPAYLAGRPMQDLLMIYLNQYNAFRFDTYGAPNMFQLIHVPYELAQMLGLATAAALCLFLGLYAARQRLFLEGKNVIVVALIILVMMPFALAKMMYRYFFAADLMSIVFAFYFPRLSFVAVLIQFASLYSYPRFIPMKFFPASYMSGANLTALIALAVLLVSLSGHIPSFRSLFHRKLPPTTPS